MVSAMPSTGVVVENGDGSKCPNCSRLETEHADEQKKLANNAQFLMNYVENTEKIVAVKAQLENELDQLKRQLEEKDVYIESLKLEESNLRNKLSKALDDNQPLLYELNSIRKQLSDLFQSREEFVVKSASLDATLKQVKDLMRVKDEELSNLRQKSEMYSQRNSDLLSQFNDVKNKFADLKEKHLECSTELTDRRQNEKDYSKLKRTLEINNERLKRSSEMNLHRATKLCNDLATLLNRHEKSIPSHLRRTLETVRTAYKQTGVNDMDLMETDLIDDDLANGSGETLDDVENTFLPSEPTETKSISSFEPSPVKEKIFKPNFTSPKSSKGKQRSAVLPMPIGQLTDAQMKAREKWSGGKPTALETLVRPIEVQQRSHKTFSNTILSPVLFQKASDTDKKKENITPAVIDSSTITQILKSFKKFMAPPLSPIPCAPVEDILQSANSFELTISENMPALQIECEESIFSKPDDAVSAKLSEEIVAENVIPSTEPNKEPILEQAATTIERCNDDDDEDSVNQDLVIDESTGNLVISLPSPVPLENEDIAVSASIGNELSSNVVDPVATTSDLSSHAVSSHANEIISFEKEFENEMRKILGVMAIEKCFDVDAVGELKFTSKTKDTIRKVLRLIPKCDKNFFNGEFFEASVKNLRFFLSLPDSESIVTEENAAHKITMILHVLAYLSPYFDDKNGKCLVDLFESYLDCDHSFMRDCAVQFALSFAILRLSAIYPCKMKPLLDKWFHDGSERKIAPILLNQFKDYVSRFVVVRR